MLWQSESLVPLPVFLVMANRVRDTLMSQLELAGILYYTVICREETEGRRETHLYYGAGTCCNIWFTVLSEQSFLILNKSSNSPHTFNLKIAFQESQ